VKDFHSAHGEGEVIQLTKRLSLESSQQGPGFEVSLKHPDEGEPLMIGFVVRRGGRWTYYDRSHRRIGDAMTRAGAVEYLVMRQHPTVLQKAFLGDEPETTKEDP
jgi:hypothetical protein